MPIEKDILATAMIETEKEIFGEGFDKEEMTLDETGDTSLEAMGEGLEGQHEPEDEDDEDSEAEEGQEDDEAKVKAEAEAKAETEGKKEPEAKEEPSREGRVPAGRLREQTEKVRAAEVERDALKAQLEQARAESRKELDAINAKFDGVLAAMRQQQPVQQTAPEAKAEEPPDLFEDPKGFAEYMQRGFQTELQRRDRAMEEMRVENSLQIAHSRYGEVFTNAMETVKNLDTQNPENLELRRKIYNSPNPGEALVQWHKRAEVLRQVGDDPVKFREQAAAQERERLMKDPEFRRQLLEELRADAEAGDNGRARTAVNLPRSLSRVSGGSSHMADRVSMDDSDSAVFGSVFNR